MRAAGLVLAGGRSSRMGVPKAALEWHGSTLLRRTCGVLQRAGLQPGRRGPRARAGAAAAAGRASRWSTTRARGSVRCRASPSGWPRSADRADVAFVCSTDLPFLHAELVRRVLRPSTIPSTASRSTSCCRWRAATRSRSRRPTGPGWRRWWPPWSRPTGCGRRSSSRTPTVLRLDDDALLADPALRAADPTLESVVNVNERADYDAARARPAPEVTVECFGVLATRSGRGRAGLPGPRPSGPRPVRSTWSSTGTSWPRSTATRPAGTRELPLMAGDTVAFLGRRGRRRAMTASPGGYFGRALVVDVTDGTSRVVELADRTAARAPRRRRARRTAAHRPGPGRRRPARRRTRRSPSSSPRWSGRRSRPARSSPWWPSRR